MSKPAQLAHAFVPSAASLASSAAGVMHVHQAAPLEAWFCAINLVQDLEADRKLAAYVPPLEIARLDLKLESDGAKRQFKCEVPLEPVQSARNHHMRVKMEIDDEA